MARGHRRPPFVTDLRGTGGPRCTGRLPASGARLHLGRLRGWWVRDRWERLSDEAGGVEGRRAIVLMALVLSLSSADGGAMGTLARPLERSFRIGNTELGLLITASSLVGAVGTLPMGALVDRVQRRRLLVVVVAGWSVAMVACGLAPTYLSLLAARLALGLVTAAAGPAVASLTGDLFPSARRSRIYGWILSGELLGAGAGLLLAGNLGLATNWRVTFFLLAGFSAALAAAIAVWLKEPERNAEHHVAVDDDAPNETQPDTGPSRPRPADGGTLCAARLEPAAAPIAATSSAKTPPAWGCKEAHTFGASILLGTNGRHGDRLMNA
jgi:MFS family permease